MTVTDLGTEFGVSAPTQKSHEVHVMDGRVRVEAKKASSHPIELNAGEARKVGLTGNLIEIPMHPEKFMSTLPQRSSRLVVNGDLNTAVNRNDDASGKTAFRLNPLTFGILANNTETDIHIDEWIMQPYDPAPWLNSPETSRLQRAHEACAWMSCSMTIVIAVN